MDRLNVVKIKKDPLNLFHLQRLSGREAVFLVAEALQNGKNKKNSSLGGLARCLRVRANKKMLQRPNLQLGEDGDLSQPQCRALSKSRAQPLCLLLTIKRAPDSQTHTDVEAIRGEPQHF